MKRTAITLVLSLLITSSSFAATTQTANVSATIDSQLALTMQIRQLDAGGNPTGADLAPNMNFGTLVNDGVNAQRSAVAYAVFLAANTSSRVYTVTSSMNQLTNGSGTPLPNATLLDIVQALSPATNADIVGDAFNGNPQAAVGTNKLLYTSNPGGDTSVMQLVYAIHGGNAVGQPAPFPGWVAVAPDQAGGSYTTSILYTLTLT